MTSTKVKNTEQQNKHTKTILKDAHTQTECWKVQICILNDALMSW